MSTKPNIPVKSSGDTFSAQELNTIVNFFENKPDAEELIPGPEGPQGIQGIQGPEGPKGDDGQSAYDIAVDNGFVGTEQEWLESLSPVRYMDGDIFEGDGETPETKTTIKDDSIGEEKLSEEVRGKLGYEAVERESNTVLFDQDYIIGNASPRTGNVLFDFAGARLGSCTVMTHVDANPFTLPDESVVIGGEVKDNVPNYIYFLVVDKTEGSEKVHVTISQAI